ncbi:hypothetical protein OPT61_g8206 [Boeremia exigua]|uniref:Uncharacterized protein n=1 Tax=Boeremia exigua TaxID=749465 RepID=A0ACC2HZJ2_9PLEO|nr:hypothetical protein OPT61_g8206 [Boeremia exigua]
MSRLGQGTAQRSSRPDLRINHFGTFQMCTCQDTFGIADRVGYDSAPAAFLAARSQRGVYEVYSALFFDDLIVKVKRVVVHNDLEAGVDDKKEAGGDVPMKPAPVQLQSFTATPLLSSGSKTANGRRRVESAGKIVGPLKAAPHHHVFLAVTLQRSWSPVEKKEALPGMPPDLTYLRVSDGRA